MMKVLFIAAGRRQRTAVLTWPFAAVPSMVQQRPINTRSRDHYFQRLSSEGLIGRVTSAYIADMSTAEMNTDIVSVIFHHFLQLMMMPLV